MSETYTYTARSAEDAQHIATFTLFDHQLAVDPGEPLVNAGLIYDDKGESTDLPTDLADLGQSLRQWSRPVGSWLVQRNVQPFDIGDVQATAADSSLDVSAWVRAGGRRLAPLAFHWQEVDNPTASEAFVDEVRRRQAEIKQSGRNLGPLDYWATWLAFVVFVGVALLAVARFFLGRGEEDDSGPEVGDVS